MASGTIKANASKADIASKAEMIYLTSSDDTWAKVWEKINVLKSGETACFISNNNAIKAISDQTRNNTVYGTISRSTESTFQISASNGNLNWLTMRLTNANSFGCEYSESASPVYVQVGADEGDNSYTIANNSRIVIELITSANTRHGHISLYCSASGSVSYKADVGSRITLSASTNTLTVSCTGGGSMLYCTLYDGSITKVT